MLERDKEDKDSKQKLCDAFQLKEVMKKQAEDRGHKLEEYKNENTDAANLYLDYFNIESKNPKIKEQVKESEEYAKR